VSLPENVDIVRVRGNWFKQDGTGNEQTITFAPLVSNLIDADAFAYIKTSAKTVTPDPTSGYFFADLIASNDPDLTPSAWTVTLQGQAPFTIGVDYNATTQEVEPGIFMKAVWLVDAAGTGTPPAPIDTYYTSVQTNAAIAEALDGFESSSAVLSVAGRTGDVVLVQGDISGLAAALAAKATDTAVVHLAGAETISGAKAFSTAPTVPTPGAAGNPVRHDDTRLSDARTPTTHTHAESDVTSLVADLAGKQPLDADLTAVAALDSSTAGAMATDGSGWIRKTYAQLKTALSLTKTDVGLGSADNTADTAKPVSTAQQTALDAKISASTFTTKGDMIVASGSATPVRVGIGSNTQVWTADSTQTVGAHWADPAATYTDEQARDAIGAALVEGDNVTITVNDAANTITIAAPATGTVTSVTAEDATVVMGGTATDITVAVGEVPQEQVTNLTTSLEGKADFVHVHDEADVSGLVGDLAGKADTTHTHVESDVTDLTADLAGKQDTSEKAQTNGYASLDGSTKVPVAQLPTGTTSSTVTIGNDSRLSNARTPTVHHTSHNTGGTDPIAPSDIGAQPVDSDLTAFAALTPTNDDIVQRKAGAWVNRSIAQLLTDLGLTGSYQAADSDLTAIAALTPGAGNVLAADGSGWISKTYASLKTALSLVKADVGLGNVDNTSNSTERAATATLTNKTLTSPVINSPTGIVASDVGAQPVDSDLTTIAALTPGSGNVMAADGAGWVSKTYAALKTSMVFVKADVGLGSVDNTSNATERAATATLTNKTLTAPAISSPTGLVKADVGLGNVDNTSNVTERAAAATLTNKTLTSPVINTPTGIVKGDVGLGNVDNTSDATKWAATATLTNKTLTSPVINSPTGIVASDVGAQPVDADLTAIAALSQTSGNVITSNGTAWTSAAPAASPWSARVETIADSSSLTGDAASGATQVGVCTALTSDTAVNAPSNGYVGAPYRYVITASGGTRVCTPTGFAGSTDNGTGTAVSVASGKTVVFFAQYIGSSGWLYGGYELLS
jgi:hypothetical protein